MIEQFLLIKFNNKRNMPNKINFGHKRYYTIIRKQICEHTTDWKIYLTIF
jgi:hypothetical protein